MRQRRARHRAAVLGSVPAALLLLVACTDGGTSDGSSPDAVSAEPAEVGTPPEVDELLPEDRGEASDSLQTEDVVVGAGEPAEPGDVLDVHYVGVSWEDGTTFASSWEAGQSYRFELGAGEVIEGWEQGLVGLQAGGRRVLTIPPELAYGDRGTAGRIGPGETLVFVVDLLDLRDPADPADPADPDDPDDPDE
jgi:peptidylprolyl isomerase